jgi:uncharacterized cupin superfamily protein
VLKTGDAAAFNAGSGNAHKLVKRAKRDANNIEIGTRAALERVHYPDVDLVMERDAKSRRYTRKNGEPY